MKYLDVSIPPDEGFAETKDVRVMARSGPNSNPSSPFQVRIVTPSAPARSAAINASPDATD